MIPSGMYSVLVFFVLYAVQAAYFILSLKKCLVECRDQHIIAISIAKCCVSLTVPISLYHSYEHMSCFTKPRLQSQIVRIIWMVPVYSLEGMLSISYPEAAFYLQVAREWYEGFVIYSFMIYLFNFLADRYPDLAAVLAEKPANIGHHKYPFCLLHPWKMGSDFLSRCKNGVFQYVLVRCALTAISLPGHAAGWYVEGEYSLHSPYLWMISISCISQMFALYSLFLFYHALHEEIYVLRPFAKFICIKIVVFFSWFQGVSIEVLVQMGHISALSEGSDQKGHSVQEVAGGIQDLLICMEMFLAAIAFYNSFPVSEFSPNELERDSLRRRRKSATSWRSASPVAASPCHSNTQRSTGEHERAESVSPLPSQSVASASPMTPDCDISVHNLSNGRRTDEEEQLLLFPAVNRRLDLREPAGLSNRGGTPSYPIVSFWGSILQLVGGGEIIKRDDPYNDDDNLSDVPGFLPRGKGSMHEVTIQQTTTRREAILTPADIREQHRSIRTVANKSAAGDRSGFSSVKQPVAIHASNFSNMKHLSLSQDDAGRYSVSPSFRSPAAVLPTSHSSQYRWRSGKDPLHQRSGDGIARFATPAPTDGLVGDAVKPKSLQQETWCNRTCGRLCGGCLSTLLNSCSKWTFGRYEVESIIASCLSYLKAGLAAAAKFCGVDRNSASSNVLAPVSDKQVGAHCLSGYGIYGTPLLLPALWTVLIPVELMQDFTDLWLYVCEVSNGIFRTMSKRCGIRQDEHDYQH